MGNKFCRSSVTHLKETLEFLSCDEQSDDEDQNEMKMQNWQRYQNAQRACMQQQGAYAAPRHGVSPAAHQQIAPAPNPNQYQGLPGESMVVTGSYQPPAHPGESMLVTGSEIDHNIQQSALQYHVPGAGDRTRSLQVASPPPKALEPTKSFDVEAPYQVGNQIEIWSTSQQAWCPGHVDKANGEWITISYKGGDGRAMSKIMPNGHEHLHFVGMGREPPLNAGKMESPQKAPPSPAANEGWSPFAGLAVNPYEAAPVQPAPVVSTYFVGDEIEIYSNSQGAWCSGKVDRTDGEWLHISYRTPKGQAVTKIMPCGHAELRSPQMASPERPQTQASPERPQMGSPEREYIGSQFSQQDEYGASIFSQQRDIYAPVASQSDLPPPPPPVRPYRAEDQIEIWSTSQNAWCKGNVSKVEGDWVHINYSGPGGQPMNKIMPNGHAHVRLLQSS